MDKFREKPLYFQHKLLVDTEHFLVNKVFLLASFHINYHTNLVYSIFINEFFAVWKLNSPGVLQLFYEKVDQKVDWLSDRIHELHKFNFTNFYNENRPSLLVYTVESIRAQGFYSIKLSKIVFLYDKKYFKSLRILIN